MTARDRYRQSDTVHQDRGPARIIFAYTSPAGRLVAVIDAEDLASAWIIATGWEDQAGIAQRKAQGWRLSPATLIWEESE